MITLNETFKMLRRLPKDKWKLSRSNTYTNGPITVVLNSLDNNIVSVFLDNKELECFLFGGRVRRYITKQVLQNIK